MLFYFMMIVMMNIDCICVQTGGMELRVFIYSSKETVLLYGTEAEGGSLLPDEPSDANLSLDAFV